MARQESCYLVQLKVKNAHFLELCVPTGCGLHTGTHCSSWCRMWPTMGAEPSDEYKGPGDECQEGTVHSQACIVHKVLGWGWRIAGGDGREKSKSV